jgi:N-acetylneuraminic acid mutarotase
MVSDMSISAGFRCAVAAIVAAASLSVVAATASAAPSASAAPTASAAPPSGTSPANVHAACAPPTKGHLQCLALARTDVKAGAQLDAAPPGYGPADLHAAYALPTDGGAEATVAIIDAYDDPNAEADLNVYRQQYGLPACTTANGCFRKLAQDGSTHYPAPPPPIDDWTAEISLDLDMVSAVCPACHLLLVEANQPTSDDLGTAVNQAVAQGAQYVSNSYGGYEDPSDTDMDAAYFDHPGVVITASSGDRLYGLSYPASSQYVTAVGGTSLVRDSSNARGWSESVWNNLFGGPGSGCSTYDPKPSWQNDPDCPKRAVADVSAVADPQTGVAVYDSWGGNIGWDVYGGTSASSPIVAAAYALAGLPAAGDRPASYPYAHPGALNDVTQGNNGTFCQPQYLCIAGPGYDGPTGLGTPNGVAAFSDPGAHGVVTGTVTAGGQPVAGATVRAGTGGATTRADGHYAFAVPPGTYDVTVSAFGYASKTIHGVTVTDSGSVTVDAALTAEPMVTLSGTVTDGSGHGWPLSAKVTASGTPLTPVYTDPYTGHYSLAVPARTTVSLHIEPQYPGYRPVDQTADVGAVDAQQNVTVPVDATACNAPGYAYSFTGLPAEPFDDTSGPPAGWTVSDSGGHGWTFNDPNAQGNSTGGSGNFAVVADAFLGIDGREDTTLTSPPANLSSVADPVIGLDADYFADNTQTGDIDISTDGGTTWTNVWDFVGSYDHVVQGHQEIDIASIAAGRPDVRARFHFTSYIGQNYWEIDNVYLGARGCSPVSGGLVAGQVLDANTHTGIEAATVTGAAPTKAGFYWAFSPGGSHEFTAAHRAYTSQSATVDVAPNYVTRADFALPAGRLATSALSIGKTVAMGSQTTASFTVSNTGTAPATVSLDEQPGGVSVQDWPATGTGAPRLLVKAATSPRSRSAAPAPASTRRSSTADAGPWADLPDYPTAIMDNGVARADDGTVYSVGGTVNGAAPTAAGYAYDPSTRTWTPIADAPAAVQQPATAFIGGKLILAGGFGKGATALASVQIYDPGTRTWHTGADLPHPRGASGAAVLDGKLYVVAGCNGPCDKAISAVDVYDPTKNTWQTLADYPDAVAYLACGGVGGAVACAGGIYPDTEDSSATTWVYVPSARAWTKSADVPYDVWGAAYSTANDQLLLSGGAVQNGYAITNQGVAFSMRDADPATGHWAALPNSNNALYRGGGACGLDKIGGSASNFNGTAFAEELPGYDQCGTGAVPWLSATPSSATTLAPGQSITVHVTLDAGVVDQPGAYLANLGLSADTPYWVSPVTVTMTATAPKTWGKIAGTVTSGCAGAPPLPGATVQIDSFAQSYTLKTDSAGGYALWLDRRNNPLSVIVAKDGYLPVARTGKIRAGGTTRLDVQLAPAGNCG